MLRLWYAYGMPARPSDTPVRNSHTHVQFRMTPTQKDALVAAAPAGMSVHQAAKWLLLRQVDQATANVMADRAADGYKRLTA